MAATAVGKTSFFTLSNVIGSVEDIEIVIDSPLGDSVPTQVQEISKGTFKAEFCPRVAGEHQVGDHFTMSKTVEVIFSKLCFFFNYAQKCFVNKTYYLPQI